MRNGKQEEMIRNLEGQSKGQIWLAGSLEKENRKTEGKWLSEKGYKRTSQNWGILVSGLA